MPQAPLPPPPSLTAGLPNLMSGIAAAFGVDDLPAPPLADLPPRLATARCVILLVIDGMGDAQLAKHLAGGLLAGCRQGVIDSVFPSTTASAISTFLTGLPPAGHGMTGWYQWCEEIGETLAILPMSRRGAGTPAKEAEDWAQSVLTAPSLGDRLPVPVTHVMPSWIAHSPFNRRLAGRVRHEPYANTESLFPAVERAMDATAERQFIYAYWPNYDATAHDVGPDGDKAVAKLHQIEAAIAAFIARRAGSDALLLVTADHGFITAPIDRQVDLADYPDLAACLVRPLSGERRAAYAHVLPGRREAFADAVQARLGDALWLADSAALFAAGWFGRSPPHPRFASRIGDFTLVMKADWSILDTRPGDRHHPMIGMHGGVSSDEMRVPLCVPPL